MEGVSFDILERICSITMKCGAWTVRFQMLTILRYSTELSLDEGNFILETRSLWKLIRFYKVVGNFSMETHKYCHRLERNMTYCILTYLLICIFIIGIFCLIFGEILLVVILTMEYFSFNVCIFVMSTNSRYFYWCFISSFLSELKSWVLYHYMTQVTFLILLLSSSSSSSFASS